MGAPESAGAERKGQELPTRNRKEELLAELREFAKAIKEIDGVASTEERPAAHELPMVIRDRRGRPIEVWDAAGRQILFFYPSEVMTPYAYEVKGSGRKAVERGSTAGPHSPWVIFRNEAGLGYLPEAADAFPHPVVRVEVTADGSLLANASDGYHVRRDPTGVEFEAFYDMRGCLTEAVRRDEHGADRTKWTYDDDGNTVAVEMKADGSRMESSYDRWGRMLYRREKVGGAESSVEVSYNADGSHTVKRIEMDGQITEELRRKDGTLSRSRLTNPENGEVLARTYDEQARVLEEEQRSKTMSQVTAWRYGEDGWTEVRQTSSDGRQLEAKYDSWGRLVLQKESGTPENALTRFTYKPDGSYHMHRETSEGMTADEYYRPDGSRHYSKASYKDGQVVEVDYDSDGRPLKRTSTTVHHYQ